MNDSKALKLICSGMLQSWRNTGLGPNYRYTELMPTKSGIAGMIACALGYTRGDSRIEKLKNCFELYIDNKASAPIKPGANTTPDVLFDFQTVSAPDMLTAGGGMLHSPSIIMREYVVGYRYVLYLKAEEESIVKATTQYGVTIHASVEKGNVFACQFHPEKSSRAGLQMLKNFAEL